MITEQPAQLISSGKKIMWVYYIRLVCLSNRLLTRGSPVYWKTYVLLPSFLKLKIDHFASICANVNIDFQIPHALSFPKIYRFANLHKFWTKLYFVIKIVSIHLAARHNFLHYLYSTICLVHELSLKWYGFFSCAVLPYWLLP